MSWFLLQSELFYSGCKPHKLWSDYIIIVFKVLGTKMNVDTLVFVGLLAPLRWRLCNTQFCLLRLCPQQKQTLNPYSFPYDSHTGTGACWALLSGAPPAVPMGRLQGQQPGTTAHRWLAPLILEHLIVVEQQRRLPTSLLPLVEPSDTLMLHFWNWVLSSPF